MKTARFLYYRKGMVIKMKEPASTIAAISTPYGTGGIAVIRISGDKAISVAQSVFQMVGGKSLNQVKTHTIHHGYVVHPKSGEILDEGMAAVMHGPKSYTGEDTVELSVHGSVVSARRCLESVLLAGARMAEAGEFTKRAFVNGKLDLSQAEAVVDVINSKTDSALRVGMRQLEGGLSRKITAIREILTGIAANLGAAVDYPDDEIMDLEPQQLLKTLKDCHAQVSGLLSGAQAGRIIRDGLSCVIAGSPNVGKSSVLNLLTGEQRAIVTDIAGTTRDLLEEYVTLEGILLRLIDTAGVRSTQDVVEQIGVERSRESILRAELVLVVLDASRPPLQEDLEVLSLSEGKKRIILLNKIDLSATVKAGAVQKLAPDAAVIEFCALNGEGIERLAAEIKRMYHLGELQIENTALVTNARHIHALYESRAVIVGACDALEQGLPTDLCAIDIDHAIAALGEIVGLSVSEEVVAKIFADFCVGK